jgi:hypothetical protein
MSEFKCDCHGREFKNRYSVATHKKWVNGILNSEQHRGESNGMWKGNEKIHKTSLHQWVRDNLQQPKLCEYCGVKESYDLANITGVYKRGFDNWKYLCRRCHMDSDNRIYNLKQYQKV